MATLFSDDFDRADNDSLGGNWTQKAGDHDISSNKLLASGADSYSKETTDYGTGDYDVSIDYTFANNDGDFIQLWGRASGTGTWFDGYSLAVLNASSNPSIYLYEWNSNTPSQIGSTVVLQAAKFGNETHNVKLSMNGTTLRVYFDGVLKISGTDSTYSTGFTAVRNYANTSCDNFLVETPCDSQNLTSLDLERSSSQYLSIADGSQTGLDIITDFTIEAWVKFETTPNAAGAPFAVFTKDNGSDQRSYRYIIHNSENKPRIIFFDASSNNTNIIANTAIPDDSSWHHVAVAVDISAPSAQFYIDGSAVASTNSTSAATTMNNSTSAVMVGNSYAGTEYFDGLIDDLRIWSDIRTESEIEDNYQKHLIGDESNLVAYWKFNNSYSDETSNNNDLSASGSPSYSIDVPWVCPTDTTTTSTSTTTTSTTTTTTTTTTTATTTTETTSTTVSFPFCDDFNRDNGELGDDWLQLSGTISINSNKAYASSGDNYYKCLRQPTTADYAVTAEVTATSYPCVLARCADVNNFYQLSISAPDNLLQLYKRVSGVYSPLDQDFFHVWENDDEIKLVVEGDSIRSYLNGSLIHSITDTSISAANYSGIRINANAGATSLDNFCVDVVPDITTTTTETTTSSTSTTTASTISLTDVVSGKILQRNSNNVSSLAISGSLGGDSTTVQARIVDYSDNTEVLTWQTVLATPTTGLFSATIPNIPQGGWYKVQIRRGDNNSIYANGSNPFGVGILIGCIGQSNMWYYFNRGSDLTPNSLLRKFKSNSWSAPTTNGAVSLGNKIIEATGLPVGLLDYGVSGSSLTSAGNLGYGYWTNTAANSPYDVFKTGVTQAGGALEFILWYQGESDAIQGVSKVAYQTDLNIFIARLRNQIVSYRGTLPFIYSLLGRNTDGSQDADRWQTIQEALYSYSNTASYMGASAIDIALEDTIHLTAAGFTTHGSRMAQTILYLLGEESYYRGPSIYYFDTPSSNTIDIHLIHTAGTDFTPTTDITGFTVYDGGSAETITSAVRSDAETIRLTIAGTITGTVEVKYLYGNKPTITGAVLDNTDNTLPLDWNNSVSSEDQTTTTTTTQTTTTTTTLTTTSTTSTLPYYIPSDQLLTNSGNLVMPISDPIMPNWNNEGRPSSPKAGYSGFNLSTGNLELFDGYRWLTFAPTN